MCPMAAKPYRTLRLTSPHTTGADVLALQTALNQRLRARSLPPISRDGEYGPATAAAVRTAGYLLGLLTSTLEHGATKGVQRIIRNPKLRTPTQRARAAFRKRKAEQRASTGPDAALAWERSKIGVKEHPAGSNSGPEITGWLKDVGCGAAPWCGAFQYAGVKAGGGQLTERARYTPWIVADAKTKTGGFEGWCSIHDPLAKPGDLILFDWNGDGVADHVGMIEAIAPGVSTVRTIEGNTGIGNDSNGGQVMRRERVMDRTVLGVARVRWPK